MKKISTIFFFVWICTVQFEEVFSAPVKNSFSSILKQKIHQGEVDYRGLKKVENELDRYLKGFQDIKLEKMSVDERKTMWINAYNMFTLKLILKHYPLKSIKEIPKSKRWDGRYWKIGTETLSLNDIEHKKLRPMGDPRIHFAINCASYSCPDLSSELFEVHSLEQQLNQCMDRFLLDPNKGLKIKREKGFFWGENTTLYISKIFSWFKVDFDKKSGSVLNYLKEYAPEKVRKQISKESEIKIKYLDYSWDLNTK